MITKPTRRDFLRTTAIATGATLAAPYVKTAHSAGKVTLALWDHWVPGANDTMRQVVEDWGRANNVEVVIDFLESGTANANLYPTLEAEARERSGHDVVWLSDWDVAGFSDSLEPLNELTEELTKEYGDFPENVSYLARHDGTWRAVAAPSGSNSYPMVSRLDLWREHAGIDVQAMFPAGARDQDMVKGWTFEAFLAGCKKLHAAGHPFGNPISEASDSAMWLAPLLLGFGSQLMSPDGAITVKSDGTRAALEYLSELAEYMPEDIHTWENVSNNRWLISGQGAGIINPPSAWAVARKEAPDVAAQLWHHDVPAGREGHYRGAEPAFFGVWIFAANKPAAKDLLRHLSQKDQADKLIRSSQGYATPLQAAFSNHEVWQNAEPPTGTLYNYPIRGDEQLIIPGYPAHPSVAVKISDEALIANMVAKVTKEGKSPADAIAWAESELEKILKA